MTNRLCVARTTILLCEREEGAKEVIATEIELEYQRRNDAMSPAEKMGRSAAMFAWTRQQMATQLRKDNPDFSDEQIKWQVARKLYQYEPGVVKLIEEHCHHVDQQSAFYPPAQKSCSF